MIPFIDWRQGCYPRAKLPVRVLEIKVKICIPILAGWIGGRLIETLETPVAAVAKPKPV